MTVYELKKVLNKCPNNMEVIMPVSDEMCVNVINHVWTIDTAGIVNQYGNKALLLNTSSGNYDISSQLGSSNRLSLHCDKVLYSSLNNQAAHEARTRIGHIIVPTLIGVVMLATNPNVRAFLVDKKCEINNKLKNKLHKN